jgi:diguanylate cyclase (GGDEF)-like protein
MSNGARYSPPTVRFSVGELVSGVGEQRRALITVLSGAPSDIGAHWSVDGPLVIGRDPDVEVPLGDTSCSRKHARIERDEATGVYLVTDLGSTNGTLVNGAKVTQRPLSDGDRVVVGATVIKFSFSDEVELQYQARVNELMNVDDLTGLVVKRRFDGELLRAVTASRSTGRPLSVLMMDMDGLKKINDAHGHHMGAHSISEAGKIIGTHVLTRGSVCRYGGDEFIAFLNDTAKAEAVVIAEAIRKQIEATPMTKDGVTVSASISIGVASFPDDGATAEEVSKRADEALYRAKKRGRNVTSA